MAVGRWDTPATAPDADALARYDLVARIDRRVDLKRVAKVRGKGTEYHGACPSCGGSNRFYVQDAAGQGGRALYRCRECGISGDALTWLRQVEALSYDDALTELGMTQQAWGGAGRNRYRPQVIAAEPEPVEAPGDAWQQAARAHVNEAIATLWAPEGARALAYLKGRGFTERTIRLGLLGYCPADRWARRSDFGLEDVEDTKTGRVTTQLRLHRGIVIPWVIDGQLWRVETRRPVTGDDWECVPGAQLLAAVDTTGRVWRELKQAGFASCARLARALQRPLAEIEEAVRWLHEQKLVDRAAKYLPIPGGANAVYGIDGVQKGRPALLVEGAMNAMAVQQEAGDLVAAVAVGAATHGRKMRWIARLGRANFVLISLDNDADPAKGEHHAGYWIDALQPQALRWRPILKDPNAMLEAGQSVRAWVEAGIVAGEALDFLRFAKSLEQEPAPAPEPATPVAPADESGVVAAWDSEDLAMALQTALNYAVEPPSPLGSTGLRVEALEFWGVPVWRAIDTATDTVVGVYLSEAEAEEAAGGAAH